MYWLKSLLLSGTFITEFDAGKEICRELLASDENVDRVVDALALLMAWYSFDGYLFNIENPIEVIRLFRKERDLIGLSV